MLLVRYQRAVEAFERATAAYREAADRQGEAHRAMEDARNERAAALWDLTEAIKRGEVVEGREP